MDNKRFFIILKAMLDSGEYLESVFEDILDELGVPDVYMAILDEAKVDDPIDPVDQLLYIESIRKGRLAPKMISSDILEIFRKALEYRWEFYRRSKDANPIVQHEYKELADSFYLRRSLENGYEEAIEILPFEFDTVLPLEYNICRLEEFKRNAEVILKNYYMSIEPNWTSIPKSLVDLGLQNVGKLAARATHVDKELEVFKLWRRALMAWDLVEERPETGRSKVFWLNVATKISKEFKVWDAYEPTKLRQLAKHDYTKACGWIEGAVAGCFPHPPKVELSPEDFCNKYHADSPELGCEFCFEKLNS